MGEFTHAMRNPIRERDEEIERLKRLLLQCYHSLLDGFSAGEWAVYVPDEVTLAAAKEMDAAMKLVKEIAVVLKLPSAETP